MRTGITRYVSTHLLTHSLTYMLTYYLTYDVDVLKVVGLQPDVDGLAREAAVGEGEHRLTSWLEHARHLLAHLR